jgi:hypothetical protein
LLIAASAAYWLAVTPAHPAYRGGFRPGLLIAGAGAGLTQAPLFAAAGMLPPVRATTRGSSWPPWPSSPSPAGPPDAARSLRV